MKNTTEPIPIREWLFPVSKQFELATGVHWFEWVDDTLTAVYVNGTKRSCRMDFAGFASRWDKPLELLAETNKP